MSEGRVATTYNRTLHLCSNDHDEVCFSGGNCPVCKERDSRKEDLSIGEFLEERINALELANKRANRTLANSEEIRIAKKRYQNGK